MRSPHFLSAAKGDGLPQRLVALDCDSAVENVPDQPGRRIERLTGWSAVGWRIDHHGTKHLYSKGGQTKAEIWATIQWATKQSGLTWIVCFGASRVLGLAGIWDAIEEGRLTLTGRDTHDQGQDGSSTDVLRDVRWQGIPGSGEQCGQRLDGLPEVQTPGRSPHRGSHPQERRRSWNGYCCVEDPPTVVVAREPGRPGRLQWIDLRNYGIDAYPSQTACPQRAQWIASVMERMCGVLRRERLGTLCATAGSQAMYTLRRRFLTHQMECHCNETALALERSAYVGGRCEAFRIGPIAGPVHSLDVRSMYPHVCSTVPLPALLAGSGAADLPSMPATVHFLRSCIAKVDVETTEPAYPATQERPVIYPVGRFTTTLCGPELVDAYRHGRITRVHQWAAYDLQPCLKAYADHLFSLRMELKQAGDVALEQWVKALLVGIVGKLGQRGWKWVNDSSVVPIAPWHCWPVCKPGEQPYRVRSLGWECQREVKDDWANDSIGAIAAWVCSAARVRLLDAIRTAGWSEVHYCDTDGLLVSEEGLERLSLRLNGSGDGFGQWRRVYSGSDCHVWGQKYYRVGVVTKHAGLPRGQAERDGDGLHWWVRDWLRRAIVSGRKPEVASMLVTWNQHATYRAGCVGPDGRVTPWRRNGQ